MAAGGVPIAWRDKCAGLLITLNKCRKANYYAPWECDHERHVFETCQYKEYLTRMKGGSAGH